MEPLARVFQVCFSRYFLQLTSVFIGSLLNIVCVVSMITVMNYVPGRTGVGKVGNARNMSVPMTFTDSLGVPELPACDTRLVPCSKGLVPTAICCTVYHVSVHKCLQTGTGMWLKQGRTSAGPYSVTKSY